MNDMRRLRRKRAAAILVLLFLALGACGALGQSEPEYDTYQRLVRQGDTLWDICERVNGNREDVRDIIYRTQSENNIEKAGEIRPGQILTIRVKRDD